MDTTNAVIQLCIEGTRAEFEHRLEDARLLYQRAWDIHRDNYEACIAAHYLARFQDTPELSLRWNEESLRRAQLVQAGSVDEFLPSLYLNLGKSHENLGNLAESRRYYALAASLGVIHQPD